MEIKINKELKLEYDKQYANISQEWREFAAWFKAKNIQEVTKNNKYTRVLEVGAGDGSILKHLGKSEFADELYAIDVSEGAIERIQTNNIKKLKEVKIFDGYHIPYPDKFFDLVILSHVLEHVEFERHLLREIKRVSHQAVIEVPRDYKPNVDKRTEHFIAYGHINLYTPSILRFLLKSEGFVILSEKLNTYHPSIFYYLYFNNKKKTLKKYLLYLYDSYLRKFLIKLPFTLFKEIFPNTITVLVRPRDSFKIKLK